MLKLSMFWLGPSSRMWLLLLVLTSTVSCTSLSPLSLLTGGGPNVAANTQIGKENNQGVNIKTTTSPVLRPENNIEPPVGTLNQNVTQTTDIDRTLIIWLVLIGLLGWLLPTPQQMGRAILNAIVAPFKRNK